MLRCDVNSQFFAISREPAFVSRETALSLKFLLVFGIIFIFKSSLY